LFALELTGLLLSPFKLATELRQLLLAQDRQLLPLLRASLGEFVVRLLDTGLKVLFGFFQIGLLGHAADCHKEKHGPA
jgi:hypothetical protein